MQSQTTRVSCYNLSRISTPTLASSFPDTSLHSLQSILEPASCSPPRVSPFACDPVILPTEFLPHPIPGRGLRDPDTTPFVPGSGMGILHV